MYKIPPNSILTPYRCTLLGRIWLPYKTTGFWDFYNRRTTLVPDDAQCRTTRTFTNLVSNGSFESDFTGWMRSGLEADKISIDATIARHGSKSLKYILNGTNTAGGYFTSAIAITSGNTGFLQIALNLSTYTSGAITCRVINGATYATIATAAESISAVTAGWAVYSTTFVAPAENSVRVYIITSANANLTMNADSVLMYDLTAASAVDTAANITSLLAYNSVTYHDGAQVLQYQNRLTLSGATDAKWGLKLDGTDDYLYSMNSPQVDITTPPIHLQALIKVNAGATTGWIMSKNTSAANDCQYGLLYNTANSTIDAYFNGTAVATTSTASITTGKWYMVSVDYDGVIAQCYINGNANGSAASYTATLTSAPYFRIGRRETAAQYFNGWIDSAAVIPSADKGALREFERFIMRRKGILS